MKHLLLEIEVSDKGQDRHFEVGYIIEDALAEHFKKCKGGPEEKELFNLRYGTPVVRVLTEQNPL